MKSGVQLNFFERRALADRALARLVEITREQTDTMSSRELRGIYQLETTCAQGGSAMVPTARAWIDPTWALRCNAIWTAVVAHVRHVWRQKNWQKSTYWRALTRSSRERTFDGDV